MNSESIMLAVAAAKKKLAEQAAAKALKEASRPKPAYLQPIPAAIVTIANGIPIAPPQINAKEILWNIEQQTAIEAGTNRKSFNLIGAAGTGKTTTLKGLLQKLLAEHKCPPLEESTQYLSQGAPGIALVSYTRRAVRNIVKQMTAELKSHCLTIHKILEFAPEWYDATYINDVGLEITVRKMRFVPTRNKFNPLPSNLTTIVVDESSMVSIDLMALLLDALPNPAAVQFIFLGDLNQLPPIYGNAILGKMLLELPIVELTQVYRQALESPIIALALAVKDNRWTDFNKNAVELWGAKAGFSGQNVKEKISLVREGRGKVTLHPWKKQFDPETACMFMNKQMKNWIDTKEYIPDEDLILCPWNESFGTIELNKMIAQKLSDMRDAVVYEVIAGFNKYYFAEGDKLLLDKNEAIVLKIERNPKYMGKQPSPPSKKLDRWGVHHEQVTRMMEDLSDTDIDALLETMGSVADRTAEASHILKVQFIDTEQEMFISKSASFNSATFAYAITVHKAQGSECRKVFFLTDYCHAAMLSRELTYTAITRAQEELYIIMSPMMLGSAAKKPRIKGDTLQAKLEFFNTRLQEKLK